MLVCYCVDAVDRCCNLLLPSRLAPDCQLTPRSAPQDGAHKRPRVKGRFVKGPPSSVFSGTSGLEGGAQLRGGPKTDCMKGAREDAQLSARGGVVLGGILPCCSDDDADADVEPSEFGEDDELPGGKTAAGENLGTLSRSCEYRKSSLKVGCPEF